MPLEHEGLTGSIIGAGIAVHKRLGPGFLEAVYENAIALELCRLSVPFRRQVLVPVRYEGVEVGAHRLDLLVADEIVVELKTVQRLEPIHFAIVRSYLQATERTHGLLLNFSSRILEARRVRFT